MKVFERVVCVKKYLKMWTKYDQDCTTALEPPNCPSKKEAVRVVQAPRKTYSLRHSPDVRHGE